MIWFTWRQFRTPAYIAIGGLVAVAVVLAISGHNVADLWAASGANACHADCATAFTDFIDDVRGSVNDRIYNAGAAVMYALPALIGAFWGAPLIARELEAGTHRLAWNQSITRTRWLATKLAVIGGAAAATVGLLSWALTSWAHHIDRVNANRITPLVYGTRGIVPIGYALFAFALGVTMGLLIRRTVPAMAATLAVYIAAVVSMPLWIRAHLAPASHTALPLDVDNIHGMRIGPGGIQITGGGSPHDAWVLSNTTITPTGAVFHGPPDPRYCGENSGFKSCTDWIGTLGLRENFVYQPGSHFWALQWAETGIFVAAAVLLAAFCFRWTRRLT
jgi:hypothetical protein